MGVLQWFTLFRCSNTVLLDCCCVVWCQVQRGDLEAVSSLLRHLVCCVDADKDSCDADAQARREWVAAVVDTTQCLVASKFGFTLRFS